MIDWKKENKPIIALAPMADMTDSAFCRIAKKNGCKLVFREMISAEALVRDSTRTKQMAVFLPEERPIVIQLFGSNPAVMAEAVRILDSEIDPDAFDINMGCPAYKITGGFNGASLMRDPKLAVQIVKQMKSATNKPVSVKTRLGWEQPTEILNFAPILEESGADLISIHGRTKVQGYAGRADWPMIGLAKTKVTIPVLANGDIFSPIDAVTALSITNCDGLLIARGSLGNPWIFGQIEAILQGKQIESIDNAMRMNTVLEHAQLHATLYGGERPLVTFRKHLVWYFKHQPKAKELREKLVQVQTLNDLKNILSNSY